MPAHAVAATPLFDRRIPMKTGRRLLIIALSWPCWPAAAGPDDPAGVAADTGSEAYAADRVQQSISQGINSAAQWVDSFFDDERYIAEDATTKLRLRQSLFLEHGESPEHKTQVGLSIKVPRTKKRLRLFVGSEEESTKTPDTLFNRVESRDEQSAAGVQFFAKSTTRQNLSLTTGVKFDSQELFVGPRYRLNVDLKDWLFRVTQRVRWFTSNGWEATTRLDFEHLLSDTLFFRHTVDGRWREEDEGYQYEIRPSLIQQLHSRKAIEYQWNTLFKTRPNHRLEISVLRMRYRRNFFRPWLFYEINPQLAVRNDEDFKPKLGVTFQIEIVFGGKDFRKRRKAKRSPPPAPDSRLEAPEDNPT
jgi:hypothetical protein